MKNHKGNSAFFSLVVGIIALSSPMVYGQDQNQRQSINHEVGATSQVMSPRTQNTDTTSNHIAKMKEDALNLIEEAIAYMKANGKDAALKAFNKQDGAFVKGELYVFALDYQGVLLANMNQSDAVGKNLNDAQDSEGAYFIKNLIAKAKSGGGWVTYRYQNPTTKKSGCKNSYVMPTNMGYLLGVGYYFPETPDTHQCGAQ